MTDATIAVIATSLVTVLLALIAAIVTIMTFSKQGKVETKADEIIKQNGEIKTQNGEIKTLADGHLSKVTAELAAANSVSQQALTRIEGLERLVASMTPQVSPSKITTDK